MKTLNFVKMNGAGNDFILIDLSKNLDFIPNKELTKKMCHRRKGIGADGILVIRENEKYDYELVYYNSDGSIGSLCGNGARCSIKYALGFLLKNKNSTVFICNDEIYSGEEKGENILFNLHSPKSLIQNIAVTIDNKIIKADFINTGSPHAVFYWEELNSGIEQFSEFNIYDFGRKVRFTNEFQPEGTNVNIVNSVGGKFYIRTYERGVEEETLACGTGTVASAILSHLKYGINAPITFITADNDQLIVNFVKNSEDFSEITLTGPAKINYIGSYNF